MRHFQNWHHEEKLAAVAAAAAASQRVDSVATALSKEKLTAKNRLKVCEGAVQSKLPIFDPEGQSKLIQNYSKWYKNINNNNNNDINIYIHIFLIHSFIQ